MKRDALEVNISFLTLTSHHFELADAVDRSMLRDVGLAPEQWRANVHRRVLDEFGK